MGICASCLGINRRRRYDEDPETSRLLYDDPNQNQYGGVGHNGPGGKHTDPQDIQRETEALQKIVAQTSDNLIDIFALQPASTFAPPSSIAASDDEMHVPKGSRPTSVHKDIAPVHLDALKEEDQVWLDQLSTKAGQTLGSIKIISRVRPGDLVGGLPVARMGSVAGKKAR